MDVVADFIAITECGSEDVAVHYLSTTEFNLHEAVALYNEEKAATVAAERAAATHDATAATSPPTGATPTTTTTANITSSSSATTAATAGGHVVVDTLGTTHALPTATPGDSQAYYARNPFENSSNPALREMYTTPSYVQAFAQPLTALCERAAQRDRWVLLAIRDGNFACVALPRDLWRLDAMTSIAPSIDCYEADVRTMDGRQLARDLRVNTQQQALPVLLLLDPETSYCERRIVPAMDALGALDGKAIVNELLCFLADHGSPHQYLDQRQPAPHMAADDDGQQQQQHRNNNDRSGAAAAAAAFVVEDVDEEGDGRIRHGATGVTTAFTSDGDDNDDGNDDDRDVSVEDVSPMTSPNIAIGTTTTTTTTANSPLSSTAATAAAHAVVTPISIDAWRADANAKDTNSSSSSSSSASGGVYRLRCRLPRSTLDLSLKPTTPLSVLLQYLAYVVYDADRAQYTTLPRIALYAGFPPREVADANAVTAERNNGESNNNDNNNDGGAVVTRTIAECAGIRSGDVLTVKATKQE